MVYVIYNPLSCGGHGEERKDSALVELNKKYEEITVVDFTKTDIDFFKSLNADDILILVGGDGTLNTFINLYKDYATNNKCYLFKGGNGNDFLRDIDANEQLSLLNPYLENLPYVVVNGMKKYFINNVGFGIDGETCVVADTKKAKGKKKINYSNIAVGLLLHKYKRRNARVIVDGKEYTFKNIWIAATMNGRFYGGGMKCAPDQNRLSKTVSVVVIHGFSRINTLIKFSKIFKGTHVKFEKNVKVLVGNEIEVFFDEPCGLQYDGESIQKTNHYTVCK